MQLEFHKKSNSKREAIFRNRAAKLMDRLVQATARETDSELSDQERKELTKDLVDALVASLREKRNVILSEEPMKIPTPEQELKSITDRVQKAVG